MRREDFEHLVAAAAEITGEDEIVVIGSQAILGSISDPPMSLRESMEVDMYPRHAAEKADEIDGVLGDGSGFHEIHGVYGHGVGPETAKAPTGWQERLVRSRVPPRRGSRRDPVALCLEPHDLVLAKCVAGRERDFEYARETLRHGIVKADLLLSRIDDLPVESDVREYVREIISGIVAQLGLAPGSEAGGAK